MYALRMKASMVSIIMAINEKAAQLNNNFFRDNSFSLIPGISRNLSNLFDMEINHLDTSWALLNLIKKRLSKE